MMPCHLPSVLRRTQAEIVPEPLRPRLDALGAATKLLTPLNASAVPKRPWGVQVAPLMVALLAFPELSPASVPLPSLNEYFGAKPPCVGRSTANVVALASPE